MNESRRFRTASTSDSAVDRRAARRGRDDRVPPVRSSALLGMHAQYEHSPPTSSDSTIAVDSPDRCA